MKSFLPSLFAAALLFAPLAASAQPNPDAGPGRGGRGGRGGGAPAVRSPEVSDDYRVTFRLRAPGAQAVNLLSDFSGDTIAMKKGDDGVWSYTTEPLTPGYYQYWYTMDGLTLPDPANTYVRNASGVYKSLVDVRGPGTEWMDFRDVPHGTLHEHTYINRESGTERRVVIYTPPGYAKSTQSYPVIYLLHGLNDFERGWTVNGRAHYIYDNLLADKKAVPAIVVMPFLHEVTGASGRQAEIAAVRTALGVTPPAAGGRGAGAPGAGAPGGGRGAAAPAGTTSGSPYMERDILNNLAPLVESEYRTLKGPKNQAIIGYSMGGSAALSIGFAHPDLFSYVAAFSFPFAPQNSTGLADVEKANKDYRLIWLGSGTADTQGYRSTLAFHEQLKARGIKSEFTASEGYRHDYQIWRIYLRDVLPKLFRE